jgi:hypothetical protein
MLIKVESRVAPDDRCPELAGISELRWRNGMSDKKGRTIHYHTTDLIGPGTPTHFRFHLILPCRPVFWHGCTDKVILISNETVSRGPKHL